MGVAPGQTGLLLVRRCPLSSRRTAALSYRFVGRLMSELTGNSSGKMLDVVSRDMRRTIECCGRALRRGLSGAVEPVSKHHIIKNECVHF